MNYSNRSSRLYRNYSLRSDLAEDGRKTEAGKQDRTGDVPKKSQEQLEREQWWRDTGKELMIRFGRFIEGVLKEFLIAVINGSHYSVSVSEDGVVTKRYEFNGRPVERRGLPQDDMLQLDQKENSND